MEDTLQSMSHGMAHNVIEVTAQEPVEIGRFIERSIQMGFIAGVHIGVAAATLYPERAVELREAVEASFDTDGTRSLAVNEVNDAARKIVEAME